MGILKRLRQLRLPRRPPHRIKPFSSARNYILDIMREGRRKSTIHALFDADLSEFLSYRASAPRDGCPSVTAYVANAFARTLGETPEMQAYRDRSGRRLVIFDDVDLILLVETEIDGHTMPWTQTLRSAQLMGLQEMHDEIKRARKATLAGQAAGPAGFARWLSRQPALLRRISWRISRRNPFVLKHFAGTAAVTSMGMFTQGAAVVLPITPLTLTLSIGGIETKLQKIGGEVVPRDYIHLNLSADHDVIDGAPLMRFVERLKRRLADPASLLEPPSLDSGRAGYSTSMV